MFSALLAALGGLGSVAKMIDRTAGRITDLRVKQIEAGTDLEKARIQGEIDRLEALSNVLLEETKHARTAWIRPALAAPIVVLLWKLFVFDKVIGALVLGWWPGLSPMFRTDALSEQMWWVVTVVIGAYFLTRPFEKR